MMRRTVVLALIVMAVFFCARGAMAARHCYEPDNDMDQASTIRVDLETQCHDIDLTTDEDWVRFYGLKGSPMTVETLNLSPSWANTFIELYDASGTLLDCDHYYGYPSSKFMYPPSSPFPYDSGFYYVRIIDEDCYTIDLMHWCVNPAVYHGVCDLTEDLNYDFQVTEDSGDPATIAGRVVQSGSPLPSAQVRVYDDPVHPSAYKTGTANAKGLFNFGVVAGTSPVEVWVSSVKRYHYDHDIRGLYTPPPNGDIEIGTVGGACGTLTLPTQETGGNVFANLLVLFSPLAIGTALKMRRRFL